MPIKILMSCLSVLEEQAVLLWQVQWTSLCFFDLSLSSGEEGSLAICKQAEEVGFRTEAYANLFL